MIKNPHQIFRTREKMINIAHRTGLDLLNDSLTRSFLLFNVIDDFEKTYLPKVKEIELPRYYYPLMYYRNNCHYLYGSTKLIGYNLNKSSMSLLRTVYEGILHMYFTSFVNKRSLNYYTKYDQFQSIKIPLTKKQKKIIKKVYDNFSPVFIRKVMYEPATLLSISKAWKVASNMYVHTSVTGSAQDWEYNKTRTNEKIDDCLRIAFLNIGALYETLNTELFPKPPMQHFVFESLDNIAIYLTHTSGNPPVIFPDKTDSHMKAKINLTKRKPIHDHFIKYLASLPKTKSTP